MAEAPALSGLLLKKYDETRANLMPGIERAAVAEYRQSIENYKASVRKFDKARALEVARWDVVKLASEKQAIRQMIDDIRLNDSPYETRDKLERLERLYAEMTVDTQPLERRRAAVEVFSDVTEMKWTGSTKRGAEVRFQVGTLATIARKEEPGLRVTDTMAIADEQLQQAEADLLGLHAELSDVGRELGVIGPFSGGLINQALDQIAEDPDSRYLKIYDAADPRVSGVDMSKLKLEVTR